MKYAIPDAVLKNLASRDPFAVSQLADCGPGYFNPLIGSSPAETCEKLSDVLGFVYDLVGPKGGEFSDITDKQPGIALVLQTAWAAAQYEGYRRNTAPKSAEGGTA